MYIKTITIQGFKSYRDPSNTGSANGSDQRVMEEFSPRHNVIVGRNGSGKSNFFAAIRFVLSDAYTSLTREERQRLLHEGTSTSTTLSAFVEIVFDNSDGRFPTNLPELHLRRTIGLKKDEYSLDRKSVTKAEVMNLLESAGFSRSNPYYIVPQGRITHLTNISDKERLNLLKEVAGTKVYEQKRAESTRIMDESNAKSTKIDELLSNIEERLAELETEKEELKEYNDKDKKKRCLEYTVHSRELDEVTAVLEQLEEDQRNDVHDNNEKRKHFNDLEAKVQALESDLTKAKHSLSTSSISLHQYESEMGDLVRSKTEVQCLIDDFEQASENNETRRLEAAEQLKSLEKRVTKATERLVELSGDLDTLVSDERDAKERLEATKAKLSALYAKQGRTRQFKSKADRDAFLTNQVSELTAYEKLQGKTVTNLERDVVNAKSQLKDITERAAEQLQGEDERRESLKKMGEDATHLKAEVDNRQEKRKELWREDGKLAQSASNAKSELDNAERSLQGMMDKETSLGLRSVRAIAKRLNLEGVHGPLYELFTVSDKYKAAVEAVAGNSLFHVVVDNDDIAQKLIEVMNRDQSGRVTFMPLNRLKSVSIPAIKANDVVPLIQKIEYDRAYKMAFEQVFGRTLLCSDLALAGQYVRSHGLNCVTDEGDRVDRKGALTGGYHDVRRSRLDAVRGVKRWREVYERDAGRHTEVKDGLAKLEQEISQAMGQIQKYEAKRKLLLEDRQHQARQANWTQREEEQVRQRVQRLEGSLADAEASLKSAATQKAAFTEELKSPLQQQLSPAEVELMETLSQQAEEQRKLLMEASQQRQKISSERSELEIELTESLRRRREEVRAKLDDLEGASGSGVTHAGEIELRKSELHNLGRSIQQLSGQITAAEEDIETLTSDIAQKSASLEELHAQQLESTRAIMRTEKNAERFLTKKRMLTTRRTECEEAIRDLGVLPEDAFTKYTKKSSDELVKMLHKTNESLKKFAHVNKKAVDQFNTFTQNRDQLLKRREEHEASAVSIQNLIDTLDQRKDEAIERTFKQVSKYFEEVFEQLVPAGRGQLVMQKKIDGGYEDEEETPANGTAHKSDIDNYTGVAIKVSFNSKHDEGQRIQQLSGGQKSLVALATVFAIQKCDPAPFYLFDEIDANLDPQYRTAVANMIHSLSDSAQFITTTFRTEMLAHADQFYGVYFDKQKVSTIATIRKEDAAEFIETAAEATS